MNFPLTFEEILPWFRASGQCTLWEQVVENPTNIIRTGEQWGVTIDWTTVGPLNHIMCGTWTLACFLEKWGPGEGPALPSKTVPFVSAPNPYKQTLTFEPITNPGAYKLTVTLTMQGPLGVAGPIAALGEGPMIQFYDGGPIS